MAKKEKKKRSKKEKLKILVIILMIAILCICLRFIINSLYNLSLNRYINSFDSVDYSDIDRNIPEYDDSIGHYSFSCNENDLKIMFITDIHLGAGPYSHKTDMKSIYEIMTMLQAEKPDLVILGGDNIFATPGPIFNGGGTFNNKMASKTVINIFEHAGVYFTTVFGNHDTEAFDYTSRQNLGKVFEQEKYKYCIFQSEFSDADDPMPSVTNQFIAVKNKYGDIVNLLMLIDSNAYIDTSLSATLHWKYDTIHQAQVDWAEDEIVKLSKDGSSVNTIAFFHIPISEFQLAYVQLEKNGFNDTQDTEYILGVWDEEINPSLNIRIWYGGCSRFERNIQTADSLFETLGPDGIDALSAIFCGHDHVNNAIVKYKDVFLAYVLSMDNNAYDDIAESGAQRGCTIILIHGDGSYDFEQKNVYTDLGADPNKYFEVYLDHYYYPDHAPK